MNRNFLLTYIRCYTDGFKFKTFDWFETEEEMNEYIENNDYIYEVLEKTRNIR